MSRWHRWARDVVLTGFAIVLLVLAAGCGYTMLTPARWRCGQHTYVVNPHNAPPGAVQAVHDAFAVLNATSRSVTWRYVGTTEDAWANSDRVNIVWKNLTDGHWATSAPQPWPNSHEWKGGGVFLDPRYPVRIGVIEHELGHIAGLGHSTDPVQLMYPYGAEHKSGYQGGDVLGLQQLARECVR